jgi:tetratricopeptide (TPR) repeat protein
VAVPLLALGMPALGATSLRPGGTLEGRCSDGVTAYDLSLTSGEYIRVWIEPHGDVAANVMDPSGQAIVAAELGPDAVAPLSLVAHLPGIYKLEIDCDTSHGATSYRLHLESKRSADAMDRESVVVGHAYLAAEKLARGWQQDSRRKAIQQFEVVLVRTREIGDFSLEARTLIRLGDLYLGLGAARKALGHYEQALSLGQGRTVQLEALLGAASAHLRLDERDSALHIAKEALRLSEDSGDRRAQAHSLSTLGVAQYFVARFHGAVNAFQQALAIWEQLEDMRGASEARLQLGFAYSDLSEEQNALEQHRLALILARRVEDKRLEALILTEVGNVYSKLGEKTASLEFLLPSNAPSRSHRRSILVSKCLYGNGLRLC